MKFCRLPVAVVRLLVVISTIGWIVRAVQAAPLDQVHPDATKIRVGIKLLEPFVFIGEDVQPSGFNIDLWNAIAAETLNELITDLQSGRTDLASPRSA